MISQNYGNFLKLQERQKIFLRFFCVAEKMAYLCTISSGRSAVRLAHLLWEQGVECSNHFTPTENKRKTTRILRVVF